MVDLLAFRTRELTRMSRHYRQLASTFVPVEVGDEIAACADFCDELAARADRDCFGGPACPCGCSASRVALPACEAEPRERGIAEFSV